MSGRFSRMRWKAAVVPGMPWFTMTAFMSGSSAKETIWEMVVSISVMKLSG